MALKTVRQNIIDSLYSRMDNMTDPETGEVIWNSVLKDDLEGVEFTQLPALGLYEGDEDTTDVMWPCLLKTLRVFIEFKFGNDIGIDVYDRFNYYLGVLQKTLLVDKNVGGYAYDIQEAGNTPRIVDRNDPLPGGVLIVDIRYRVRNDSPYQII